MTSTSHRQPSRRVLLYVIGGILALLLVWNVGLPWLVSISPFGMIDELRQEVKSSDGRYIAKLLYKDGMTEGYQHITLETNSRHPFGYGYTDLVEVAFAGLLNVSWRDSRTLVVEYDATKHKDPLSDIYFVTQPKAWRDVKIVYRPIIKQEESTVPGH